MQSRGCAFHRRKSACATSAGGKLPDVRATNRRRVPRSPSRAAGFAAGCAAGIAGMVRADRRQLPSLGRRGIGQSLQDRARGTVHTVAMPKD